MGRQVNFFMCEDDESEFVAEVVRLKGEIYPLRNSCVVLSTCDYRGKSENLKWGEFCLVRKGHIKDVLMGKSSVNGFHLIDETNSPVIQFHRSLRSGSKMTSGRIWAQMESRTYFEGYEKVEYKGRYFEQFYDSLARWIRRNYHKDPETSFWCGPAAWAWHLAGGEFSQG